MAAPTLVTNYQGADWTSTTAPKTAAETAGAGDVFVHGVIAEDGGATFTTPTGGTGISWALKGDVGTASATTRVTAWSATPGAQSWTLSQNGTITSKTWGFCSLRFSGSNGIGNATATDASGAGVAVAATVSLTTTQANSAVVMLVGDWNATTGARTYKLDGNTVTPTAVVTNAGNPGVSYMANIVVFPDVGAAGAHTFAVSAPASQKMTIVLIEVKGSASDPDPVWSHWRQTPPGGGFGGAPPDFLGPEGWMGAGVLGPLSVQQALDSVTALSLSGASDIGRGVPLDDITAVTSSTTLSDIIRSVGLASTTGVVSTSASTPQGLFTVASSTAVVSAVQASMQLLAPMASTTAVVATSTSVIGRSVPLSPGVTVVIADGASTIGRLVPIGSTTAVVSGLSVTMQLLAPLAATWATVSACTSAIGRGVPLAGSTAVVTTTTSDIGSITPGSNAISSVTSVVSATTSTIGALLGLASTTALLSASASTIQSLLGIASTTGVVSTSASALQARLGLASTTPVVSDQASSPAARLGLASTTPIQSLYSGAILARYSVGSTTVVVTGGASSIGTFNPNAVHDFDIIRVLERARLVAVEEDTRRAHVQERLRTVEADEIERTSTVKGPDMILRHGERDFYRVKVSLVPPVTPTPTVTISFDEGATWKTTTPDPDNAGYLIVLVRHPAFVDDNTPPSTLVSATTIPRIRAVGAPVDVWFPGPILRVED